MREFIPLPEEAETYVLGGDGRFEMQRRPLPELGPGDLLFRLTAAGIGPRDASVSLYRDRVPPGTPVGELAAAGDKASGWAPSDRVLLPPLLPSGEPLEGLSSFIHVPGRVRKDYGFRLPPELHAEDGTLLPGVALAARLLREARPAPGQALAVLGLGLLGQAAVLLARHQKVDRIFTSDASPTLRKKAEWGGATRVVRHGEESLAEVAARETGGAGVQAVLILTAEADLIQDAFRVLSPGGTVILGPTFPRAFNLNLSGAHLASREVRIQGVNGYAPRDLKTAVDAFRQGIVNGEGLVSKRIPWSELGNTALEPEYWMHGTHVIVEPEAS